MTAIGGTAPPERDERARVGQLVSRYRRRAALERLRLYRQHLQVTVTKASPLIALIAVDHRSAIHTALHRLRPPYGWPQVAKPNSWASIAQVLRNKRYYWTGGPRDPDVSRHVSVGCLQGTLRSLTLSLEDDALEMTARMGDVTLRTSKGIVDLVLNFHLPDTLEIALVGRPAHCLIQHPWFAGDDWTITQVRRSKGMARRTTVTVMTGDQPFSLPWRRLLRGI